MTLEAILSRLSDVISVELEDSHHKSLERVDNDVFYISPEYKEFAKSEKSRFIIFSAAGASGKTTLARHIAYKYNLLFWDLSKIELGENSFSGTMLEAMSSDQFSSFRNNFAKGNSPLVIDAFDEAVIISGRNAVKYLLSDLVKYSNGNEKLVAILFARTETAKELMSFFSEQKVEYCHYEIGFIKEYNAKCFVKELVKKKRKKKNRSPYNSETMLDNCINEQFALVKRILDGEENAQSFLGYPPVLEAFSMAYDEDDNLMKLLNELADEGNRNGTYLIKQILTDLLNREQHKMISALQERWDSKYKSFTQWSNLYTPYEQIVYVLEYIILGEVGTFYNNSTITGDIYTDYINTVQQFIPEHPFIQNLYEESIEFTGPAFRDYSLACLLSSNDTDILIDEYFNKNRNTVITSQLLFDFYTLNQQTELIGGYFPIVYNSFKAKERYDNNAMVKVYYDGESINAQFIVEFDKVSQETAQETELIIDKKTILRIQHLENSNIDIPFEIIIGENLSEAEIIDSSISCDLLRIECKNLYIRATKDEPIIIISKEPIETNNTQFKIDATKHNLKIDVPNLNDFYALRDYKFSASDKKGADDLLRFAMTVEKILDCMRKHKKDVPAKDREYIDNILVADNDYKKVVLDYLTVIGIIYIDSKEPHLYKLSVDQLKQYGVGWQSFVKYGIKPYEKLFESFELWMVR